MNLRTSLTIILATVTTLCSSAQFSIGLEFGGVRNNLDTDAGYAYDLRYDGRNGATVGIAFGYDFNDWFALRAAPTYIQKGYKMHRTGIYEGIYEKTGNTYIDVPVTARFSFGGKKVKGFVDLGAYVGRWTSSRRCGDTLLPDSPLDGEDYESTIMPPDAVYHYDESVPFNDKRDNRFDGGLVAGLGVKYRISDRFGISCGAHMLYGLSNLYKKLAASQPRYNTTYSFTIGASYFFKTNK